MELNHLSPGTFVHLPAPVPAEGIPFGAARLGRVKEVRLAANEAERMMMQGIQPVVVVEPGFWGTYNWVPAGPEMVYRPGSLIVKEGRP